MSPKIYLITAAVAGAEPNRPFLTCLKAYAKRIKGQVIVAAVAGGKDDIIDGDISENFSVVTGNMPLGKNVSLRQFQIRATQMNPLVGLDRFIQNGESAIIPATKQFFRPVADMTGLTRAIYSTGACTLPSYRDSRAGEIAQHDHVTGAVVVECGADGYFHARHITWLKEGFTDLGTRVERTGKQGAVRFFDARAEAVVAGDWHCGDTDPVARAATFEMFNLFEPRRVVIHDIFNGHSINHHERDKAINQARAYEKGRLSLSEELLAAAKELQDIARHAPRDATVLVAKSNHDDWLNRYLNAGEFMQHAANARLCLPLAEAMLDGKDPLEVALRARAKLNKVHFLKRKEAVRVLDWEIGQHGDAGLNGAKASIAQLERLQSRAVIGHRHTPEVYRGCVVVGTNTYLDLDYNQDSPSTWLHANAVIWPDGSVQLLVMLNQRNCKWTYL